MRLACHIPSSSPPCHAVIALGLLIVYRVGIFSAIVTAARALRELWRTFFGGQAGTPADAPATAS